MTILVIEDEELILDGVSNIIKTQSDFPCKILKAHSGEEGLELSRKAHPHLIITDIVMPGLSGLEVIQYARKEKLCDNFIILSGHENFSFAHRAIQCGVIDYILKPINKERLLNAILQVSESRARKSMASDEQVLPEIEFLQQTFDTSKYPISLQKIIRYIENNCNSDISLQTISDELFFHPSYISTLINKYMGSSFSNYLDFVRIKKAAHYLIYQQNLPISEISHIVGYINERRMYYAFKKHLNMTPGDFRKLYEVRN